MLRVGSKYCGSVSIFVPRIENGYDLKCVIAALQDSTKGNRKLRVGDSLPYIMELVKKVQRIGFISLVTGNRILGG